ncbi:cathepsin D precursor, putative [Perkinsus marinus ATCC 50983]|uniref:Cathepsin D, putative n=1 Tax=Perkinsus marinus (strain ATCC 50983 / TXsc) TaxID=423536 RepID=C5LTA2_PERM5|nr:cathepsin D precursor, putative [Perkinsus marinus ATCC 50983]EER00070.1 cathepsin D precursor, putative [Perkinsus marinus ATCC 50983]|eukprot:XP_002767352.1 cathepsin D precursor, putative [Perkinsus marinus ATCC 50983]
MLIQLLTLINIFAKLEVVRGAVLKLDVRSTLMPPYGNGLFHILLAEGGQKIYALVDTGSDSFFLNWKDWFDRVSEVPCLNWPMGCYKCLEPCSPGAVTKTVIFEDDQMVKYFQHKATLTLGPVSQAFIFGLTFDQEPPVAEEAAISVMGFHKDKGDVNFPSLMKQLQSSQTINNNIFAIYLFPPADHEDPSTEGALLLGGGDPALYQHPLQYVKLTSESHYYVNAVDLQVGDASSTIEVNMDVRLDTGANYFSIPEAHYDRLMKEIKAHTSNAAGVDVHFEPDGDIWLMPCEYLAKLPPLRFGLGSKGAPVHFTITYMNYAENYYGTCYLVVERGNAENIITFPDRMLIGNYFQFEPDRVGLSKLASSSA